MSALIIMIAISMAFAMMTLAIVKMLGIQNLIVQVIYSFTGTLQYYFWFWGKVMLLKFLIANTYWIVCQTKFLHFGLAVLKTGST